MGWPCVTHGRKYRVFWKNLKGGDHYEYSGINTKIILILLTPLSWLELKEFVRIRIWTAGGPL